MDTSEEAENSFLDQRKQSSQATYSTTIPSDVCFCGITRYSSAHERHGLGCQILSEAVIDDVKSNSP